MLLEVEDSQLVLVDYQERLIPAMFQGELCLHNAMQLARAAHILGVPAWATEQNPSKLGSNPAEMKVLAGKLWPKCISAPAKKV